MTVQNNDKVVILNTDGKLSVVPLQMATSGKGTLLNTADKKGVVIQTSPVTVGGKVIVMPDGSGKNIAVQGTGPGQTIPPIQLAVDRPEWMTCALYYADKRDIRIAWEPGDNNKYMFIAISTVRFPQTLYDGVIEWSAFTPAAERELIHRTIRYGQWQFITMWGVLEKDGEYKYSLYHAHCQVFSPVQSGVIDHYFKCYVTTIVEGVLDVDDITVSINGGGYAYRLVIPAYYGGDYIACYGDTNTGGYPEPAEDCAIEVKTISSHQLSWIMLCPPFGDSGMGGSAAFAIRGIDIGSSAFGWTPYAIMAQGTLDIEMGYVGTNSFWIYGDTGLPPTGENGTGVNRVYGYPEGIQGYTCTFWFYDGNGYNAFIAYRLIDPDRGVFEILAQCSYGGSYKELYFGDIQLCTNDGGQGDYHGFLGLGNVEL